MGIWNGWLPAAAKWKKKAREGAQRESPGNLHSNKQHKNQWERGRSKKVQVYASPPQLASADDFVVSAHRHCDLEFDPEKDYAQVLAEARTHMKISGVTSSSSSTPWFHSTSSPPHLDAYRELHIKLRESTKQSKNWRYLLFWQRSYNSHHQQGEDDLDSIFSTPPHPSFKQPCKNMSHKRKPKGTKIITLGTNSESRPNRRANSGPLYTDGLPFCPSNIKHMKKSYSGPLDVLSSSEGSTCLHDQSYELLHCPRSTSPLYTS